MGEPRRPQSRVLGIRLSAGRRGLSSRARRRARLDEFHFAVNDVRPSLIRVEADEVTYNLHILIRFELEQGLINDGLKVADLPGAWNEKYRQYLGIAPPNDADGVLQDIHWSAGLFGYFATYSLGNLYASQFFAQADRDLGGLAAMFRSGEFSPLRPVAGGKHPPPRPSLHGRGACPEHHRRSVVARCADAALADEVRTALRAVRVVF